MPKKFFYWICSFSKPNKSKPKIELYYQDFITQGGLRKIRSIKQSVIQMELSLLGNIKNNRDFRAKEVAFIQKKISYLFNSKLNSSLAVSHGVGKKRSQLVPPAWIKFFSLQSLFISYPISKLKWVLFLTALISKSVLDGLLNAFKIENFALNNFIEIEKRRGRYTIMLNSKFPKGDLFNGDDRMDFGNWYSSQTEQGVQLTFIYFSSNNESKVIKYGKRDVFCKNFAKFDFGISGKSKITLILYSIGLLIKSIRELCTGKCESFVCFYELILSKRYSIVQKNELPDKLLFSDSHGVLMPIWVNQLMKLGVTVDYLFFSSYDSPTLYYEEDPRQDFWKLNSWPNLICVDQYQSDFIKKNLMYSDQNVEVKGFPYFNDNNYVFNDSDRFVISLFDFEPSEGLLGLSTISECGYNSFQVNEKFLSTIYFIAQELDALILHKPKRKSTLENRSHEYVRFINGLDPFFYKSLPPEVSPARLILNSDCTISMPITTPGLIAKKYGRNSIFFDPSGKISQDDPALRKTLFTNDSIKLMKILKNFKNNRFENY